MANQTQKEEFYNALTHGIGFLLSLLGFVLLLYYQHESKVWNFTSILLYAVSLSFLYMVSTLYHYAKNEKKKYYFRILDHISIYYLIAGTYSPVVLLTLSHSKGWLLFWLVWGIAAVGTLLKIFFTGKFEVVSLVLYLVMGWLIMFDISTLKEVLPAGGMNLLIAGGIAYSGGIVFYVWEKLPFNHVIWHLFVLAGSICHYLMIFMYII
ncbi:PAQR family membrane homeostasis protein TrhA [Neptunitalea lumnitzerae]|uniref:Hemolysin D n=1 Tax=Neptunitalea lumnitzerae TaxID=2965509 RepID=A0ABQ5MHL8_9FLAO|nr:hemolysin III family protein [Neptunitalea sp. Y10]GLB48921.1 hemolysin D [Neptunitalea sp. Y10]